MLQSSFYTIYQNWDGVEMAAEIKPEFLLNADEIAKYIFQEELEHISRIIHIDLDKEVAKNVSRDVAKSIEAHISEYDFDIYYGEVSKKPFIHLEEFLSENDVNLDDVIDDIKDDLRLDGYREQEDGTWR
jgi:DNA primase large subunit